MRRAPPWKLHLMHPRSSLLRQETFSLKGKDVQRCIVALALCTERFEFASVELHRRGGCGRLAAQMRFHEEEIKVID